MSRYSAYDDKELQELMEAGDDLAYAELFTRYSPSIFQAAMVYLKDKEIAREIVQEVFLKVWEKRAEASTVNKVKDWLFIIARNSVFDHFRKLAREKSVLGEYIQSAEEDGYHIPESREAKELLHAAIAKLSPQQQKVFMLAKLEGYRS